MKNITLILLLLFIASNCKSNENQKVKFSDEINRYNFLDKEHDLQFIYDFEALFSIEEKLQIEEKIKNFKKTSNVSMIIISNKKIGKQGNIVEDVKVLNKLFSHKFNLKNTVVFEISTPTRQIGMASSESLKNILTDSICNQILKNNIGPKFKQEHYFEGIKSGIDAAIFELKKTD